MNTIPQVTDHDRNESERPKGWDAFSVWSNRVRQCRDRAAVLPSAQGWDPYFVWLSRVRKPDQ